MVISENGIFDSENEAANASASAIIARKMSCVSIVTSGAKSDGRRPASSARLGGHDEDGQKG
jgi:hypothetical protein